MQTSANLHLSSQFNSELNQVSNNLMELGGLVEKQLKKLVKLINNPETDKANQVIELEQLINQIEIKIDKEIANIIARRQPAARDLRLLLAISKATANLERAGDELTKIAFKFKALFENGYTSVLPLKDLRVIASLTIELLHKSLDALARLDLNEAVAIIRGDDEINQEFDGFTRQLITYMMEDPRTISKSLELIFIAKALERVGDHSKNIAELIVYIVKGEDVRHLPIDDVAWLTQDHPDETQILAQEKQVD